MIIEHTSTALELICSSGHYVEGFGEIGSFI